jgi:3-oxoadipate enol-lactonase
LSVPVASVNGIDVYYERRGSGPRLLFVNGSLATLATMSGVVDALAERFDVVAHDQRGLGRTSVPEGPYSMAHYAADAIGLLDHVGWSSSRVFGISFGGMVAQELAVTVPERVERLALACTSPGGAAGASFPLEQLDDLEELERGARWLQLIDTRCDAEWLAARPDGEAMARSMARRMREGRSEEQRRGERLQLAARRGHDASTRLGAITCPTLVAAGRHDGIAPLANSDFLVASIPEAELRVFEGGHSFFLTAPEAMSAIIEFLDAVDDGMPGSTTSRCSGGNG